MILCVDFDGTIVEHQFPAIGPEVPGAFKWMKEFQAAGAKLILWTMRSNTADGGFAGPSGDVLTQAVDFCRKHGIEFWAVNNNPDQYTWTDSSKCYANYYIDDAAIGCPLVQNPKGRPYVDWEKVGPIVMELLK